MNRRQFLGAGTVGLAALAANTGGTFGYVHVETHGPFFRVWCNDIDVTRDCFAADDRRGFADVYSRNEAGHIYRANGHVARHRIYGQVRIVRTR